MRILLVDDVEHALNRLKISVGEVCPNAELNAYSDPEEALAFARENKMDIAFLDIQMSGMDGIALGKELKDINPATRLVYCTGYSDYALEALKVHASGYLLKPITPEDIGREIDALGEPVYIAKDRRVQIRTFGSFEVYVDGEVVVFNRQKSKEVLAILVDNNGTTVKTEQIANMIWEDGVYDISRQKQMYTIISDLRKSLGKVKCDEIVVKGSKGYAIDRAKVDCDYFRLMDGDASVLNSYSGKYMHGYDWAELNVAK